LSVRLLMRGVLVSDRIVRGLILPLRTCMLEELLTAVLPLGVLEKKEILRRRFRIFVVFLADGATAKFSSK